MNQDGTFASVEAKLDQLNERFERLAAAWEAQRPWHEVALDLAPTIQSGRAALATQLAAIEPYVDREELLELAKHLAASAGNIIAALDQLQNVRDLLSDAAPLTVEMSESLIERLDDLERRGYFALAKQLAYVLDCVVRQLDANEVRRLGDQIGPLFQTVRTMNQPEVRSLVAAAVAGLQAAGRASQAPPPSLWTILTRLRDPDLRRGLAAGLEFLRSLGAARVTLRVAGPRGYHRDTSERSDPA